MPTAFWEKRGDDSRPGLEHFLRARAQIIYKFEEILSRAYVNFEEQNKVFEPSIIIIIIIIFFLFGATAPQWAKASLFTRFLNHTQRRTTVDRTPLNE